MNKIPFEQTYHIICFVNFFLNMGICGIWEYVGLYGLVAFYDIQPGNGVGLFLQP